MEHKGIMERDLEGLHQPTGELLHIKYWIKERWMTRRDQEPREQNRTEKNNATTYFQLFLSVGLKNNKNRK